MYCHILSSPFEFWKCQSITTVVFRRSLRGSLPSIRFCVRSQKFVTVNELYKENQLLSRIILKSAEDVSPLHYALSKSYNYSNSHRGPHALLMIISRKSHLAIIHAKWVYRPLNAHSTPDAPFRMPSIKIGCTP